ncbi:mariner Mos1 transposase [Trichonephila clavipes]|nr:mariner Mos1 transposase [Trichonephila clavipes]
MTEASAHATQRPRSRILRWAQQLVLRLNLLILQLPGIVSNKPDDQTQEGHHAKPTKDIVKALGLEPLAHAAYSPDLAPSDYHLFASLGHALADQRFTSYENVKSWLDDWLA